MKKGNAFITLALLFFLFQGVSAPGCAAEALQFGTIKNPRLQHLLELYGAVDVAPADLNGDGLDELITRPEGCRVSCHFSVLADMGHELADLGTFEGRALALGSSYSHGIRNLLVFNDDADDYSYVIYVWAPEHARYVAARD